MTVWLLITTQWFFLIIGIAAAEYALRRRLES